MASARTCPDCGTGIPVDPGFVGWCACGWNLTAPVAQTPGRNGRVGRLYERAGTRLGRRLLGELAAAPTLEPRLTPSRVAAYAVAATVHVLSLGLVAGGVAFAALAFPHPVALLAAALMVATGASMRPRLGKVPDEGVVERRDAPRLHELVDRVAAVLGTRSVDVVAIDSEYNASWTIVGVRRRRVLKLGLPLLAALEPDERVALIGHELAHGRNGDSTRGLFVGSALEALSELYRVLAPDEDGGPDDESGLGILAPVVNLVFWIVSRPILGLLYLELHLLARDSQRAEFLADSLAARVAGTGAVVRLHEKTLLESTFQGVVHRVAYDRGETIDLFSELAAAMLAVPERELERRRRVARLEAVHLTSWHPPMAHRIELLERRKAVESAVELDGSGAAAIDAELSGLHNAVQRRLVDERRDALYY